MKSKSELKKIFDNYISNFDLKDPLIELKYYHTFRVADLCEQIAKSLNLSDRDINLSYLIGMLHDIGRFYQVDKYGTFIDEKSVNHTEMGAIMLSNGLIKEFIDIRDFDQIIIESVKAHADFSLEDVNDEYKKTFMKIVRDADKLDIFYLLSKRSFPFNYDNFDDGGITPAVLDSINSKMGVKFSLIKTKIDEEITRLAFVYDINYKYSFRLLKKEDYINKYIDLLNVDKDIKVILERLRGNINKYIEYKVG